MKKRVKVSVLCITYNQVEYIEACLDNILSQETNFEYEIIVHDDASTDGTREIVEKYEKKYPKKIIALYEKDNQYSKDPLFFFERMIPRASGEYIAFCEGDDYWTDRTKLQQQFDYMELHPDCTLCFHNADVLYMNTGKIKRIGNNNIFGKYKTKDNIYNAGNINMCKFATRNPIPTASDFFRRRDVQKFPECFYLAPCADLPLEMILSHIGYAYYIPKAMSIYRRNTGISVTDSWQKGKEKTISRSKQFIEFVDAFNEYSDKKYNREMILLKRRYELDILIAKRKPFKIIFNQEYREIYNEIFGDKIFIKLIMRSFFPNLYQSMRDIIKFKRKGK